MKGTLPLNVRPEKSQSLEPCTKADVQRWLSEGETLEMADLSNGSLLGIDLSKLNCKGASFQGANLCNADLAGAILEETNFKGANLTGANLNGANLSKANFENAVLDNASLIGANLSSTCFKQARLIHATLKAATLDKTDFSEATLQSVNLSGAKKCQTAKFNKADLSGARFDYTGLDKVELEGVGAKFNGTEVGLRIYLLKNPAFGK